jgi:hypothetical protein
LKDIAAFEKRRRKRKKITRLESEPSIARKKKDIG